MWLDPVARLVFVFICETFPFVIKALLDGLLGFSTWLVLGWKNWNVG